MQHAAQLVPLSVSLGRHTAEHDLLAVAVADLRREDLKGTHLVAAHRSHVTSVDGKGDRSRRRRCRSWCRDRFPLQSGADVQRPLADRLDHWRVVAEREELLQHPACAAVRRPRAHLGENALILRRAAVSMISAAGAMVRRDATPQRQGPNRGARTSTTRDRPEPGGWYGSASLRWTGRAG